MASDLTAREQDQELYPRPNLLAGIIESAMDAVIAIDGDHRIVLFNPAAEKIFSCPATEAVGSSVERFIPQRFRAGHRTRVMRFAEGGVTSRTFHDLGTLWGLRATGEEFPIEASISKVESGAEKFFTVVIRDITERHRAEEAARESEQRFRSLADAAPVLIWMSGTDKLCTYFNKPWLDFTGRSIEQEFGNGWAEGVHPDDFQRCLDTYTQSFDRREEFRMEYRLRRHDGEYRWVLDIGKSRFNQDHSFAGYIGIAVDVTEGKEAEEALRESEERLRLAVQAGKMYAYTWNIADDLIERSGEPTEILGVKSNQLATRAAILAMVHPDDKQGLEAALSKLTVAAPTLQITYRIVHPDGRVKWLERNGRAYFDVQGKLERVVGMVVDVSERKQMEQALADMTRKLIEAQEQERTRIGRELHDDINQRLALLNVELERLQEKPSEVGIRVQELRKQVTDISNDVQGLSHDLHSSKLEYLGVVAGIKSWCKEFAERQRMQIDCSHDVRSTLPAELGLCLFRVLQEALTNAVKHSGVKRIEVELSEKSGEVHLTIRDLGKGFDVEAVLQGKGLGLTSMRERVRLVNGTITIESKPASGTTIHVRVPLESKQVSAKTA